MFTINLSTMKLLPTVSVLCWLLHNTCITECTLFGGIRVERNTYNNVQFTLSDIETNCEPLRIVFNVQEVAAGNAKFESRIITNCSTSNNICYKYKEKVFLGIFELNEHCVLVNYSSNIGGQLTALIDTKNIHLYGGAEHLALKWPFDRMDYDFTPYVTQTNFYQAILEPYWLTSTGYYVYVDQSVPLFIELSSEQRIFKLTAYDYVPYAKQWDSTFLNFTVCKFRNPRAAHEHAVQHNLGRSAGLPDVNRVKYPIWSTWVRYKADINTQVALSYAKEIHDHGFGGQFEIDDDWEQCYGSLTPNESKFPNLKSLVHDIKQLGFKVTIWVHPFVNTDCSSTYGEGVSRDYFVKNFEGVQKMRWWRGNASYIDFTNPEASNWYRNRLIYLKSNYGIDSFKFDGGESSFVPSLASFHKMDQTHPETIVTSYVQMIASLGGNVHTRVARGTQKYAIFVTMMDRDSRWDLPLGLTTLIPQLLQLNILGYSFVLPDMIGGNFYGIRATAELFIRWLQANVFMPSMQFSVPPWDFGEEVTIIAKKFVDLHFRYSDEIINLMRRHVKYGDPVNPPIWWIAPDDPEALECDSEYLLGENILVAPIVQRGSEERDIYLPKGTWRDENNPLATPIKGPVWLRKYAANLSVLPYFRRINADELHSARVHKGSYTYGAFLLVPILVLSFAILYVLLTRCLRLRKHIFKVFCRL